MTTPESPLDKKDLKVEEELTLAEKISRLEHTLENAYNHLGKYINETELKLQQDNQKLQEELSRTLHLMNMSTLQNIIAIRETIKALINKNIIDHDELDKAITEELRKAMEAQQKIILENQKAEEESQEQSA